MDLIETSFAQKSCQPLLETRIFDVARVIQMNMEIALILAHIILLSPSVPEDPTVRPFFVQLFYPASYFIEALLAASRKRKNCYLNALKEFLDEEHA